MPARSLLSLFASLLLAAVLTLVLGWGEGAVQTIGIIVGLTIVLFVVREAFLAKTLGRDR